MIRSRSVINCRQLKQAPATNPNRTYFSVQELTIVCRLNCLLLPLFFYTGMAKFHLYVGHILNKVDTCVCWIARILYLLLT